MKITSRSALLSTIGLLVLALPGHAANPSLDAYERGIDDPSRHSKALRIADLNLKLDIVGAIADTTVTVRFSNPSDNELEGKFAFELPEGAVITGYSLDVAGALVDGVLVDPLKARREYQERVRQRVDPGVASVSRANVFSTTLYPIRARGDRTIRLRFSAPIHALRGLSFPLSTRERVGRLAVAIRGDALTSAPKLTLPNNLAAAWQPDRWGFSAGATLSGEPLKGELRVAPVRPAAGALVTRHANGKSFFQLVDSADMAPQADAAGKRVRVYWDRSLSRRNDRLTDEIALLEHFFAEARPSSIDLVVFNSSGARVQRAAANEVAGILRGVLYRGATSFAVLENLRVADADVCLVFSDGVVTIDPRHDFTPGCAVYPVSTSRDADRGFLRRLAHWGGGEPLWLGSQSEPEILARLRGLGPRVIGARSDDGRVLQFASLSDKPDGWAVVGEAPQSGAVILRLAGLNANIVERRYELKPAREARFDGAGALWAFDQIALVGAGDSAHAQVLAISRQYSVASPALSFIVLENPGDYVEADIAPPANYPKEAMDEYREAKAEHDEQRRTDADERLGEVIEAWDHQKEWWARVFERGPQKLSPTGNAPDAVATVAAPPTPAATTVDAILAEDIGKLPDTNRAEAIQRVSGDEMNEVLVTGARASMQYSAAGGEASDISVNLESLRPERTYLKALEAAAPGSIDRVLAREEYKNRMLPSFYFDVAEWLFRKNRRAEAIEMLLSALELPVANEETASMVADRLLRYGRADRAIWLFERAHEQTDYLPQPRRTLALALVKRAGTSNDTRARGDLTRALELLNEIVVTPWDDQYDGIELIALMEANNLLPKLKALGVSKFPLDVRLQALLDVDIRVIIDWNTGATDMDLWVDEPTGERAIYSNPRTRIGGQLSNDMTSGYGPEEYLLRRAPGGSYQISVNVFASDSINPNGTTVVTAHLFRDFGRTTQREETMELELKPDDEGKKLIGTFAVK
jgi:tetratricopeptide (TPR) repeat protein